MRLLICVGSRKASHWTSCQHFWTRLPLKATQARADFSAQRMGSHYLPSPSFNISGNLCLACWWLSTIALSHSHCGWLTLATLKWCCFVVFLWLSLNLFPKWCLIKHSLAIWQFLHWCLSLTVACRAEGVTLCLKPHVAFAVYNSCGLFLRPMLLT